MFIGIGVNLTGSGAIPASSRYTVNGLELGMVGHFGRDEHAFDSLAKYTVNGLTLSMVSDFSADIHASEV